MSCLSELKQRGECEEAIHTAIGWNVVAATKTAGYICIYTEGLQHVDCRKRQTDTAPYPAYDSILYNVIQYDTKQYNAMQEYTMQRKAVRYRRPLYCRMAHRGVYLA
jgi:hypothetical protein